ncbi:DUF2087 domain-containing protein [Micrococcus sp. ACRRV]|uniref:DUF2087 domain-containing protein n=1 Tax=Micrococcus sp. ACRRV TaxID=2918203 RepID=UPI001EF3BD86|nr:DUF2087 domain-containing protein [Micrococcus sp. ACRRV]MCG7423157.1 DUF2087 domain-containing protein [Micrococcus sp. ACRRV]
MHDSLRPTRSFVALLRNPRIRRALGALLTGSEVAASDRGALKAAESVGLTRADDDDTPVLQEAFLADAVAALDRALGPLAVLDGGRIRVGDLPHGEVDAAVGAVVERVLSPGERVREATLNDRLALFVVDVAFFRRHAYDLGLVDRELDGSAYWRR